MDIFEVIKTRRSIRKYKKEAVGDKQIEKILDAARYAPSGLNNQPWRFKVVSDKKKQEEISRFTKYSSLIKQAPALIIVCLDKDDSYDRDKDIMAVGACIENMLLQAHALGLGACWLGEILNKKIELAACLKLNKNLEVMAVVTLGAPLGSAVKGIRKSIAELIIDD